MEEMLSIHQRRHLVRHVTHSCHNYPLSDATGYPSLYGYRSIQMVTGYKFNLPEHGQLLIYIKGSLVLFKYRIVYLLHSFCPFPH